MNRIFIIVAIACIGCAKKDDHPEQPVKELQVTNVVDAKRLDGYWLSEEYLMQVASSRSIHASQYDESKFWGFQLEEQNMLSESAKIVGFTPHEGGYDASLKFDTVKGVFINNLNDQSTFIREPFNITLEDSNHLSLNFDDDRKIYRNVVDAQTELRKILFTGQFKDLLHDGKMVEFNADGRLRGLANQTYFDVVFDFGEGIEYDVVIFYPSKTASSVWSNGDLFHFKFASDTLKLFGITPDWEEMDHEIGDAEHILLKQ